MWNFKKKMKNLDGYDLVLIKLGSMSFILFVISIWARAMTLVHSVHWGWFLGVAILTMLRPWKKMMM